MACFQHSQFPVVFVYIERTHFRTFIRGIPAIYVLAAATKLHPRSSNNPGSGRSSAVYIRTCSHAEVHRIRISQLGGLAINGLTHIIRQYWDGIIQGRILSRRRRALVLQVCRIIKSRSTRLGRSEKQAIWRLSSAVQLRNIAFVQQELHEHESRSFRPHCDYYIH